ncbi:hypothetical protein K469DRAFT_173694 [Zopfia rhizophila CBS 207.26]|uniref:Cytochrome P450 n=1 Tax=Zopfia rhizophila CBS 207.26 TaxID=1314779 RepID=A0A6A6DYX4_9PEZI|nr:hypothetical protein K469DRAFT_173694 [Zopfia rhizophila CBS 207.26]
MYIYHLDSSQFHHTVVPTSILCILLHNSQQTGLGRVMAISKTVIEPRSSGAKQHNDMVVSSLKHGLSATGAEVKIAIALIAGSDTISTAMRATLLSVISNPLVYVKLQHEIDCAIAVRHISSQSKTENPDSCRTFKPTCLKYCAVFILSQT